MRPLSLPLFALAVSAACATTTGGEASSSTAGATVTVLREKDPDSDPAALMVDGRAVARVAPDQFRRFTLAPGVHRIGIETRDTTVTLAAGRRYWFLVSFNQVPTVRGLDSATAVRRLREASNRPNAP